jgi:hypothetical protein
VWAREVVVGFGFDRWNVADGGEETLAVYQYQSIHSTMAISTVSTLRKGLLRLSKSCP